MAVQKTKYFMYEHVGHMNQVAGMKRYIMQEGKMQDVRAVDVWNGSGLNFTILSDRASDIYSMTFQGLSLCWLSNVGVASPNYFHNGEYEWNNNFSGGMLVTCGLSTVGLPSVDAGESLNLHGDISNIPSDQVSCNTFWKGDEYFIEYVAKTHQAKPFAENLCLTRTITMKMGENRVRVHDKVENLGIQPTPFMILYHMNFGYPLLDVTSRLYLTYDECYPTSELAKASLDMLGSITPPNNGYNPRAYNFTVAPRADGFGYASVINEKLMLGTTIRFDTKTLTHFNIWKCLQQNSFVVGMEPCNCRTWGRAKERESRNLVILDPFQSQEMELEILIHAGASEIEKAVAFYTSSL